MRRHGTNSARPAGGTTMILIPTKVRMVEQGALMKGCGWLEEQPA
jgi:hypothetical protein